MITPLVIIVCLVLRLFISVFLTINLQSNPIKVITQSQNTFIHLYNSVQNCVHIKQIKMCVILGYHEPLINTYGKHC